MKYKSASVVFLLLLLSLFPGKEARAQNAGMLYFDLLQKRYTSKNDTVYIVNFWATWCKPCIEELPVFEKCNVDYRNKPVKIVLANLDFNSKVQSLVEPFLVRKNIQSEVLHILDTDANSWINRVDTTWSGAIPATVIYKNGKKLFFREGEMKENELTDQINIGLLAK